MVIKIWLIFKGFNALSCISKNTTLNGYNIFTVYSNKLKSNDYNVNSLNDKRTKNKEHQLNQSLIFRPLKRRMVLRSFNPNPPKRRPTFYQPENVIVYEPIYLISCVYIIQ